MIKEKIEEKIKEYKRSIEEDNLDICTQVEYDYQIMELEWVLSELKKIMLF